MRVLLLLRGAPGCGKSTFIEKNNLKEFALSADDIRLLCQSVQQTPTGEQAVSMKNDETVWSMLFQLLEVRMQHGEFTVIDATNSKTEEMNRYRDLAESYRYRTYCVDFTDIPIDECKKRNMQRLSWKQVPESVIDKMYARFTNQKIPGRIKKLKPDDISPIWMRKFDMSNYNKVVHVGDIHGCYTALMEYFKDGIDDNNFYIFTGDYIDRGIENVEVMKFLFSIADKKNVLMLEGNHERWLWIYGNGGVGKSKEFEFFTRKQFEAANLNTKDFRMFYRKLGQCAWYKFDDKDVFVSHGGIAKFPDNLTKLATSQMIKGVGDYEDFETIAQTWMDSTSENFYQVHGHRNLKKSTMQIKERVFNLENDVEFGGKLRILELTHDGFNQIEIQNDVFRNPNDFVQHTQVQNSSVSDVVLAMRRNKFISEKNFGHISSFNFTRDAFMGSVWDEQTVKARGLYIDVDKMKVVARAYDKFFNEGERPNTKFSMLRYSLTFPVTAYVKENGYLGIVSYDEYSDDLFVTTKSDPTGDYAKWLRERLEQVLNKEQLQKLKEYCKEKDVSFVFEHVDMERDPHIIKYDKSKLFLLSIVHNDLEFKQYSYEEMWDVIKWSGLVIKEKAVTLNNWQEFFDWYTEITKEDYLYNGRHIEGFVVEDAKGFMMKFKLYFYKFWKHMRGVAERTLRNGYINVTSQLYDAESNEFYGFLQRLYNSVETKEERRNLPRSIITLRNLFYADRAAN